VTVTLDEMNFASDLAAAIESNLAARWKLERGTGMKVFVTMASELAPSQFFQARLAWSAYPEQLPSLKFRDPATGRLDLPTAWPKCRGFRPQTLDACVSWCAEGHQLHPEWCNDPRWRCDPSGNPLLRTLTTLQFEMDTFFEGRFGT
jgi:hypothetical protein